jgi:HD-GYP domain-containing protein (c-di-GMP phosphodiesterase class II)
VGANSAEPDGSLIDHGGNLRADEPWLALDRFIRSLEACKIPDQFAPALATICEATRADLAFIFCESTGKVTEAAGSVSPEPPWSRDLARTLFASLPRGGLWHIDDRIGSRQLAPKPVPHSAAILPIDSPRSSWLVAVSVDSARLLDESEFRLITVVWRLQLRNNRHIRNYESVKDTLFGVVRCLSAAVDAKDPYTSGHSERVARIAVRLGEEMALSRGEISDLYLAGLLHDVGKIGVPDHILLKAGPLSPAECLQVREHPVTGERILANVSRLAYLRPAVRGHHERFDGLGYPDGLKGEQIPFSARIIAVADSCDAMMSARRYRNALAPERIESIFRAGKGTQWDANIVERFLACREELYAVCEHGLGQSVYLALERAAAGGGSQVAEIPISIPVIAQA